jgi:oligosaccharide repeat unit polymerase
VYEFLLYFGAVLWIAIGVYYIRRPSASMFHPATYYLIFHGLVFVIRPILAYVLDYRRMYYAYQFTPTQQTKEIVLAGADLGFVCFMAAVLASGKIPMIVKLRTRRLAAAHLLQRTFLIVAITLLPVAIWSTRASLGTLVADSNTMIRDAATGFAINTTGNGYFNDASLMLLPIVVVFVWLQRFRWWSFVPLLIAILIRAATGSRWPFVMAFFSLSLFFLYSQRRRWVDTRLIVGAVLVLGLFTIIGQDRGAFLRSFIGGESVQQAVVDRELPLESMDYANMEFFEYLVDVIPEKTGTYDYFLDNLQVLTEPIPRVLWKGKPVGAPIQLYSLYDYGYPIGMTNSLPGEGWAQLGWIGIAIWCSLFGYGYGKLYTAFVRSEQTPVQVALYIIFLPLSIAVFRDGFLLTMLKTSLFTLLPLLVWGGLLRLQGTRARVTTPDARTKRRRPGSLTTRQAV